MAIDKLVDITDALSQRFAAKLSKNWNRQALLASKIPTEAGYGKNIAWDVAVSGASASSYAEGANVADGDLAVDKYIPATLSWGHYWSNFGVSGTEFDAAASSGGSSDALINLFETRVMGSVTKLASLINQDLWTGDGTDGSANPNIVGLHGGALEPTGLYAGINRGTHSEWAGNVLANGGVARPLTVDLMEQMDANLFNALSVKPDLIVCDSGTFRKYKGLFQPGVRTESKAVMEYNTSTYSDVFFQGIPVFRDKDAPAGTMTFLNISLLSKVFLPHTGMSQEDTFKVGVVEGVGEAGDETTPTGIPFRIFPLGKTGDNLKFMVLCKLNLKVKSPAAMGYIKDISIA